MAQRYEHVRKQVKRPYICDTSDLEAVVHAATIKWRECDILSRWINVNIVQPANGMLFINDI